MNYRLQGTAIKTSPLNSSSQYDLLIPCDRDAVLESVIICQRDTNITADNTNFSKFQVKNGSSVIFERSFQTVSLNKETPEALAPLADPTVDSTTCLTLHYVHNGTGLAQKLDLVFVFRPSRP